MPPVHHLEIDVSDHPDALHRIVCVCRRRACRIVSLHYTARGDGEPARVALGVEGPYAPRIGRWLDGLVDVLEVRTRPAHPRWHEPAAGTTVRS